MKIKKLRLKNGYKRFHDLTIDLGDNPKRIVALVGPNGCGKSSVFDGMLFLHRSWAQLGATGVKGHEYHSMHRTPNFDFTNIELEFTEGSYEKVRFDRAATGKETTTFSFRSPYRYNSRLQINEVRATSEIRLNQYGAGDASELDAKMEENYRRLYAAVNTHMQKNDCKPSEARAVIIGELNGAITNCLSLEISNIGNVEANQGCLYFKKPGQPSEFEFNVLSSGEKEVVDILLDLYLRKNEYDDTVFLLDEPELHINTSIQKNLLIEIDKLVGTNCQIWITTHSIGFLRVLQSEMKDKCQIIHFRPEYELASKPYTLTPVKTSHAVWKDMFSIALDDLAQLISPKRIVYCEGRAEPGKDRAERGLDANVFNTIFAEDHSETLFLSSGGNTELDQRSAIAISILGKVFSDLDVWVLKDRDMASGKETSETDRQLYLKHHPHNHRVLRRWEIENYLYDPEVLKAYCLENGLLFDEKAYNVFVADINNQNLKDETARIKNFCGIRTSVNPETFKRELAACITRDMAVYAELRGCIFDRA